MNQTETLDWLVERSNRLEAVESALSQAKREIEEARGERDGYFNRVLHQLEEIESLRSQLSEARKDAELWDSLQSALETSAPYEVLRTVVSLALEQVGEGRTSLTAGSPE